MNDVPVFLNRDSPEYAASSWTVADSPWPMFRLGVEPEVLLLVCRRAAASGLRRLAEVVDPA